MNSGGFRDLSMPYLASNGFQRLAYRDWGDPANSKVLICVHGFSRNRKDFDTLAAALSGSHRILSIDMPGRGNSDWLLNSEEYNYPFFRTLLASLIAVSGATTVDWVGTSMGGIIGMTLASLPGSPIRRLVLNDIGPFVSGASRQANTALAQMASCFETEAEGIEFVLETRRAFGPFSPEAARKFARDSLVQAADGKWRMHYDPRIAHGRDESDSLMWEEWSRISAPVLTLWGTESSLLSAVTVERMRATGPRSAILAIDGVGHCPGLTTDREIEAIRTFLAT